jgi:hypothetical protein
MAKNTGRGSRVGGGRHASSGETLTSGQMYVRTVLDEADREERKEARFNALSILAFIGWCLAYGLFGEVLIAGLIVALR